MFDKNFIGIQQVVKKQFGFIETHLPIHSIITNLVKIRFNTSQVQFYFIYVQKIYILGQPNRLE